MGNSSSNENPLNIPDSHFEKYGLNEAKNVLIFKSVKLTERTRRHTKFVIDYGYDLVFLIPQTKNSWSHVQNFRCDNMCVNTDRAYFYEKNLGYVRIDNSTTMAELYKKYNITSPAESLKESMKDPPSINL